MGNNSLEFTFQFTSHYQRQKCTLTLQSRAHRNGLLSHFVPPSKPKIYLTSQVSATHLETVPRTNVSICKSREKKEERRKQKEEGEHEEE